MSKIVFAGKASRQLKVGTVVGPAVHSYGATGVSRSRCVVDLITRSNRRENTKLAYDGKAEEWHSFIDSVYKGERTSRYTVTGEKLYAFLFYQAFRNKYKRTKEPVEGQESEKIPKGKHGFDYHDYMRVLKRRDAEYNKYVLELEELEEETGTPAGDDFKFEFSEPSDPIGYSQINTYFHTIKNIWKRQVSEGANNLPWDHVETTQVTSLLLLVRNRKARIAKRTYQEKLDSDFSPYASKDCVPDIENKFWNKGMGEGSNAQTAFTAIRHRCVFLSCYCGLLRHETMYHGELSDMLGLDYPNPNGNMDQFIQVLQIGQGEKKKKNRVNFLRTFQ